MGVKLSEIPQLQIKQQSPNAPKDQSPVGPALYFQHPTSGSVSITSTFLGVLRRDY